MNAYLEYDPNVFRGKTELLPCDDPEWCNFTRYFAALGLKKLVSTSYVFEDIKRRVGASRTPRPAEGVLGIPAGDVGRARPQEAPARSASSAQRSTSLSSSACFAGSSA